MSNTSIVNKEAGTANKIELKQGKCRVRVNSERAILECHRIQEFIGPDTSV